MTITYNNERKVIDTVAENGDLRLEGKAEFFSDRVYLHGRIIYGDKYAGQYNDMNINLTKKFSELMTSVSLAIDELRDYITNIKN